MAEKDLSGIQRRAAEISAEAREFLAACAAAIGKSKAAGHAASTSLEETMILKVEHLAAQCMSLAILKLSSELDSASSIRPAVEASVNEETESARIMLEEIRQAPISDEYPALLALRAKLNKLSFLP